MAPHPVEARRGAQADLSPRTGAPYEPYIEDNESSEMLALSLIQKHIFTHP